MNRPDLMKYMDVLDYLRDYYQYRKAQNARFSYQKWAQEMGVKNRSFLRLVVTGKRPITSMSQEKFVHNLEFKDLQRDYFQTLIRYRQTANPAKKDELQARLLSILRAYHDQTEISEAANFLTNSNLPTLQVLLSFHDVLRTPQALAPLFQVDAKTMTSWLEQLEKLHLAKRDDNNQWAATHMTFKVPDKLGSLPMQQYSSQALKRAAEAVHFPVQTRRFRTLLVALNEFDYKEFLTEFNEVAVRLLSRYSPAQLSDRKLYQFTSALFPALHPEADVQKNT